MTIKDAIAKVVEGNHLSEAEAHAAMSAIMDGQATPAQIAAYIVALRMKGETVEEVTGSARAMRERAVKIRPDHEVVVDTCGTGGDGAGTFNISTAAAFVAAGAGVAVAKHGNRSVSSRCGSADVLKALGVKIEATPQQAESCLNEIGIAFLFAPLYHGAMKHALAPRQEIGVRTIFNLLGPLTNPAGASAQVMGVYAPELTDLVGQVLLQLGSERCFIVHGMDGLDEISITGKTKVCEGRQGRIHCYYLQPKDFGLEPGRLRDLKGGGAEENAKIIEAVLRGEKGPRRDVVLVNAAPAIVAGRRAETLEEGIAAAARSIDTGAAYAKLDALREMTNR